MLVVILLGCGAPVVGAYSLPAILGRFDGLLSGALSLIATLATIIAIEAAVLGQIFMQREGKGRCY